MSVHLQENLELKLQGNMQFCDFKMPGFATTTMLYKVGQIAISMVASVLLEDFKRKQADALLQCGIIFCMMIPHFLFADLGGLHGLWPVPPVVQVLPAEGC